MRKEDWLALSEVVPESGDVLIKHVWKMHEGASHGLDATEHAIRIAAWMHPFDCLGADSAEHAAMVGTVNNIRRIFEADGDGIRLKSEAQSFKNGQENAYLVYGFPSEHTWRRDFTYQRDLIRVLCDGFATRLAQLQAESPPPLDSGKYSASVQINNRIFEAARVAHIPARNQQTQRYGYGNMVSMALPNVIPDSWYSNHDQRVLEFIRGENKKIAYICSGLVASLLQAWSVAFFGKRVFNDPAQIHPKGLEHHFLRVSFPGMVLRGRWGLLTEPMNEVFRKRLIGNIGNVISPLIDAALFSYESQFGVGINSVNTVLFNFGGRKKSTGQNRATELHRRLSRAFGFEATLQEFRRFFGGDGSCKVNSLKWHLANQLFNAAYPHVRDQILHKTEKEVEQSVFRLLDQIRSMLQGAAAHSLASRRSRI